MSGKTSPAPCRSTAWGQRQESYHQTRKTPAFWQGPVTPHAPVTVSPGIRHGRGPDLRSCLLKGPGPGLSRIGLITILFS